MKEWKSVLLPSRYGLFATVVLSVLLIIIFSLPDLLERVGIGDYITSIKEGKVQSASYAGFQAVSTEVNNSTFAADAAIFAFWASVGMMGYACVMALKHVYDNTKHLVEISGSSRWGSREIWVTAGEKLLIRMVGIVLLFGWAQLLIRIILPTAITNVTSVASDIGTGGILFQLSLAFIAILGSLHITTVLIRIVLLRTRVFLNHVVLHGGH